jgi:hypothetical protein
MKHEPRGAQEGKQTLEIKNFSQPRRAYREGVTFMQLGNHQQ